MYLEIFKENTIKFGFIVTFVWLVANLTACSPTEPSSTPPTPDTTSTPAPDTTPPKTVFVPSKASDIIIAAICNDIKPTAIISKDKKKATCASGKIEVTLENGSVTGTATFRQGLDNKGYIYKQVIKSGTPSN